MKIVEKPTGGAELGGATTTVAFTISAKDEMMRNLINSIYSQKEKTVTRELMANAFDAQIAANKRDEPIDVLLPTSLDPNFIVRDYGAGMSHDFVLQNYSVLGYSTKGDSNDQTGMFGVGSKSPLSITDTFTVRCFDKPGWNSSPHLVKIGGKEYDMNATGRVRLYTISLTAEGVPQISHTFDVLPKEDDKIERGGVEIRVPVPAGHRSQILEGVFSQQFSWFDRPVNFGGAADEVRDDNVYSSILQIVPGLYVAAPSRSSRYSRGSSYYSWQVFARQGSAVYPVAYDQIANLLPQSVRELISALNEADRHVLIDLPLGTADVTMAREHIQYNQTTRDNITKRISTLVESFQKELLVAVGDARTVPMLMKNIAAFLSSTNSNLSGFSTRKFQMTLARMGLPQVVANAKKWHDALPDEEIEVPTTAANGVAVLTKRKVRPAFSIPSLTVTLNNHELPEGKALLHSGTVFYNTGTALPQLSVGNSTSSVTFKYPCVVYVVPSHLFKWSERIRLHAEKTFTKDMLPDNRYDGLEVIVVRGYKRNLTEILSRVNSLELTEHVYTVDDLPQVEDTIAEKAAYSKTGVYPWSFSAKEWSASKIEPKLTEKALYVTRAGVSGDCFATLPEKDDAGGPPRRLSGYTLARIISLATELGIIDTNTVLYRTTESQAERISGDDTCVWEYLTDYLYSALTKLAADPQYSAYRAVRAHVSDISALDYNMTSLLRSALSCKAKMHHTESAKASVTLVARLCEDPIARYYYGARWASMGDTAQSYAEEKRTFDRGAELWVLLNAPYSSGNPFTDKEPEHTSEALDFVDAAYADRYRTLERFYGCSRDARGATHLGFYLDGYLPTISAEILRGVPEEFVKELDEISDRFKKELDAAYAAVYKSAVVDEDAIVEDDEFMGDTNVA